MSQVLKTNFFQFNLFFTLFEKLCPDPAEVLDEYPAEIINYFTHFPIILCAHSFYLIFDSFTRPAPQEPIASL